MGGIGEELSEKEKGLEQGGEGAAQREERDLQQQGEQRGQQEEESVKRDLQGGEQKLGG